VEFTFVYSEDTWHTCRNLVASLPVTNTATSVGSSDAILTFPRFNNSEEQRPTSIFRVIELVLYPDMICAAHQIFF